ncbi:hypothetical protein BHE74_00031461 [Ensete ventricosum]|nr:hypothetical protein GW17_00042054 [Ensete ventricosum]RWW61473.1 hypothetical protein BHE74_00031461 [Ensete ventricosum]RZS02610.1 hypothetical protein BHM03_00032673 [Ensete ventricosum]
MKDERAKGPLHGFPFVQKIQDAPIPSHFRLLMLEVYNDSSDPTEHVVLRRRNTSASTLPVSQTKLPRGRMEGDEQTMPRPPNVPLNSTQTEIFFQIQEKGLLKTLNPLSDPGFTFESESEYLDHDDALVVTTHIAFHKLGMTKWDLIPMTSTLIGFTGDAITPVGIVTLPVTFSDEPRTKTLMVHFMVVDLPSTYNVIIGRPTLNKLRAVVSTYHRSMKFPTNAGPGEIKSDPQESR